MIEVFITVPEAGSVGLEEGNPELLDVLMAAETGWDGLIVDGIGLLAAGAAGIMGAGAGAGCAFEVAVALSESAVWRLLCVKRSRNLTER